MKKLPLFPLLLLQPSTTYQTEAVFGRIHVYTVMNEPAAEACFIFFHYSCNCPGTTEMSTQACKNFDQYAAIVEGTDYILDGVRCPPSAVVDPEAVEVLRVCNARFYPLSQSHRGTSFN